MLWTEQTPLSIDNLNDLENRINTANASVVAGKDKVYNACISQGKTPTSKDFSALEVAILALKIAKGNALESDVLAGKTFSNADGLMRTGNILNHGASAVATPYRGRANGNLYVGVPKGAFTENTSTAGSPELVITDGNFNPENIRKDVNMFGTVGTFKELVDWNLKMTSSTNGYLSNNGYMYTSDTDMIYKYDKNGTLIFSRNRVRNYTTDHCTFFNDVEVTCDKTQNSSAQVIVRRYDLNGTLIGETSTAFFTPGQFVASVGSFAMLRQNSSGGNDKYKVYNYDGTLIYEGSDDEEGVYYIKDWIISLKGNIVISATRRGYNNYGIFSNISIDSPYVSKSMFDRMKILL